MAEDEMVPEEVQTGEDASSMDAAESAIRREVGEIDAARRARVGEILKNIERAEKKHSKALERIKQDIAFAANLKGEQWDGDTDKYVSNITLKHVKDRSDALYAKNPRVRAKRVERMDFQVWDEKQESLQAAMMSVETSSMMGQDPPDPEGLMALIQDIQQAKAHREMIDKMGRTLTILYHHHLNEPQPRFKKRMKATVKRAVTGAIGWVKIGYQRQYEKNAGAIEEINDITKQMAHIEMLAADLGDDLIEEDSAKIEELRVSLESLQSQQQVLVHEGLVHTFPRADKIILDESTLCISTFEGTQALAEKFLLTPDQIKETYDIDVGKSFMGYTEKRDGTHERVAPDSSNEAQDGSAELACVYEYWHKPSGTMCVVCEGYPDYLREPSVPPVRIKRFFPYFPVMFNENENPENEIYPQSDVRLIMHQQKELNRSREALRQHRIANQPWYATTIGNLSDEDKETISSRVPHHVHDFDGLAPGTKIGDVLQAFAGAPIDPNLYETNPIFEDVQRQLGAQEANFGTTGGATATESSIAEGGRISSLSSATDDLEETLSEMARAAGEILLLEMSEETVKSIAGLGAVWPGMSRQEMADEIYLSIVVGSNGRPNRAQEIANLERLAPLALQVPGISPTWMARKVVEVMDEGVDLTEALLDGLPSILSMNAAQKAQSSVQGRSDPNKPDAKQDPNAQGDQGGQNKEAPPGMNGGAQPAMPSAIGVA